MTLEQRTIATVTKRLIPLLIVLYVVAFVDRSAVGVARLTMSADINLSAAAYGLGAGMFFIGYFLFEVPSNIAMHRFGAKAWFARILVTWGVITALTGFTQGPVSFYILRFLLGAAEAGFFPGVVYYLTLWYPQRHRNGATARFILAQPIALLIMGPLGGLLIGMNGLGLHGWQWLFIVVGLAAVVMVIPTLTLLPDGPSKAKWLEPEQAAWIEQELEKDRQTFGQTAYQNPWKAILDRRVLLLACTYLPLTTGAYGISLWLPTLTKSFGVDNTMAGVLSGLPYIFTIIGILAVVPWSRRFKDAYAPLAILYGVAGVSTALSVTFNQPVLQMVALCAAAMTLYPVTAIFFPIPSKILTGASAAAGIALVNSIGNLGGFVGPYVVGAITEATGSVTGGMYFLGAVLCFGIVLTYLSKALLDKPHRNEDGTVARTHADSQ